MCPERAKRTNGISKMKKLVNICCVVTLSCMQAIKNNEYFIHSIVTLMCGMLSYHILIQTACRSFVDDILPCLRHLVLEQIVVEATEIQRIW